MILYRFFFSKFFFNFFFLIFFFEKRFWKKKLYKIISNNHFLMSTFFENCNSENNDILFNLFVALNPHQCLQDWYCINKMLPLSLGEQKMKIAIGARVLLCSWFCLVNLPFMYISSVLIFLMLQLLNTSCSLMKFELFWLFGAFFK